jgi:fluoride exporter
MKQIIAVFFGGAAGSVARYLLSMWARGALGEQFPYGTVLVNVIGSFAMGALAYLGRTTNMLPPTLALALTTGVLGGFTTYSTFNDDTVRFLQGGAFGRAALNVGLTLFVCLAAGFAGVSLGRWIAASSA